MIQDISPHRLRNEYQPPQTPQPGDVLVCAIGQDVWVRRIDGQPASTQPVGAQPKSAQPESLQPENAQSDGPSFAFPQVAEVEISAEVTLTYLFSLDGTPFWLPMGPNGPFSGDELGLPATYQRTSNRDLRLERRGPAQLVYATYTAIHLADWYAKTRFCGRCAQPLVHHPTLRAMRCPSCGNVIFPRLNPAVIVCVHDPSTDRIAITRYAAGRYKPIDALVAGFVEIGETLEECVAREVKEELGLAVKDIRYYKSQPWGVAGDILSGFWAEIDGDPTIHMDKEELGCVRWATPHEIPGQGDSYSLTNEMMCLWRDEHLAAETASGVPGTPSA